MELSKHVKSESVEMQRSDIHLADYNPRRIADDALRALKKGIKKFGLVGGIVVNRQTGNTVISGHQRLAVMDDLQKYDEESKQNDYVLRVDVVDIDPKSEKELNILMNNPNAQGEWDFDRLKILIPEIDYKDAGLTEADLSVIGLDSLFETVQETNLASEIESITAELNASDPEEESVEAAAILKDNIEDLKGKKEKFKEQTVEKAQNMDAFLMLSFDSYKAKSEFCEKFGYAPEDRFIKGEDFEQRLEFGFDGE